MLSKSAVFCNLPVLCVTLLFSLSAAGYSHAQSLSAPAVITADGDGLFSYTLTFQAPPVGTYFGSIHYVGLVNCDEDMWIDGFCVGFIEGSSEVQYVIEGSLVDPGQDGRIRVYFDTCNPAFNGTIDTLISHTVPSRQSTWSTLKAEYHR